MALPNRASIPGGFFAFDAMHTLHHNAWNNIIVPILKGLDQNSWEILAARAEGSHIPHDMQVSFQRLVDPLNLSSKKFKGLKACSGQDYDDVLFFANISFWIDSIRPLLGGSCICEDNASFVCVFCFWKSHR